MSDKGTPTLYEVSQLIQDNGLEGEEDTALVLAMGMIRGGLIVMTGLSSGGKTQIVDAASGAFPSDDVFEVPGSTSPTALFEKEEEMNGKRVHVYPDLASLPEHLESLLKAHGEGVEYKHEWTETSGGRHLEGRTLTPPDTIIVCIASDNENLDLNDLPEFRNRGFIVPVDGSEELTDRVLARQALEEAGLYKRNVTKERAREIQRHLGNVPVEQYGRDDSMGTMKNPCAPAIKECDPLPKKFTEARRDFPRLLDFMRSIALYHYPDRMTTVDKDGNPVMLVTPADCWLAMKVFGEKMILSALNLQEEDMAILRLMRADPSKGWTVSEMQTVLREQGHNISDRDVARSFKGMKTKGYVRPEKNSNGVNEYVPSPFASAVDHQAEIDWQLVVDETKHAVREILTERDADEYIERYCRGDGLLATHPFTGETVNITEDDEFETLVGEAYEGLEEVFDEPMYGDNEQTNDDNEDDNDGGLAAFANPGDNDSSGELV